MNINSREYLFIKNVIKENPKISVGDMGRLLKLIYNS